MSPKAKRILTALAASVVAVWLVVCGLAWRLYRSPLGTPLQIPTATPAPMEATPAPTATTPPSSNPQTPPAVVASPTFTQPLPTATPVKGMCGGPPVMYILIMGARMNVWDNSDTIRVIRVDFVKPEVVVIPFPRDLIVELPQEFVDKTGFGSPVKLASVNNLGSPAWLWDADPAGGVILLAQVLEQNFGVRVDHYVALDGLIFDNFVNDIGGLPICLPEPVVDEEQGANFPAGCQVLDGHDALLLARIRKDVGDFGRIERQHLIVKSLLKQMTTNPYVIAQLPALVNKYRQRVLTSLTPQDITQLLCLFTRIDPQNEIRFLEVPKELFQDGAYEIYLAFQPAVAYGLKWDQNYLDWVQKAMAGEIK